MHCRTQRMEVRRQAEGRPRDGFGNSTPTLDLENLANRVSCFVRIALNRSSATILEIDTNGTPSARQLH